MLTNNIYFLNTVLKAGEPMQFSVGSSIALLHEQRFLPVSSQGRRDKVMPWCPFHMDTSPTDKDSTCMTQSSLRDPAWFLKNADLASSQKSCCYHQNQLTSHRFFLYSLATPSYRVLQCTLFGGGKMESSQRS